MVKWRAGFQKVKHSLGRAYEHSRKFISIADRAHALASRGFDVLQERLEPDVRESFGSALDTYTRRRRQLGNIDAGVREISNNVRQAFPEYLG